MTLTQSIQSMGLSHNEAKVYLASLQIGEGTVNKIAQKAGMPRTSVYQLLEVLKEKGLVSSFQHKTVLHYEAVNPRHLLQLLKEKQVNFETILPQLDALVFTGDKRPRVKFFSGKQGIKLVLEELLAEGKKTRMMQTIAPMGVFEMLPRYFPRFVERRVKEGIRQQTIIAESKEAHKFKQKNEGGVELRAVKIMPKEFIIATDETICGNKIFAFPVKGEDFALIIESKEMSKTRKQIFKFIWEHLPA